MTHATTASTVSKSARSANVAGSVVFTSQICDKANRVKPEAAAMPITTPPAITSSLPEYPLERVVPTRAQRYPNAEAAPPLLPRPVAAALNSRAGAFGTERAVVVRPARIELEWGGAQNGTKRERDRSGQRMARLTVFDCLPSMETAIGTASPAGAPVGTCTLIW